MSFVLDRYLLREVLHSWLWVTLVVWVILLSNRLVRYLGKAVSGDIPAASNDPIHIPSFYIQVGEIAHGFG